MTESTETAATTTIGLPGFDALLAPIAGESPTGESLRYEGTYDAIQQARRDDEDHLPRGVWEANLRRADWRNVASLCSQALAERSKDLQVAAWLLEANLHLRGLAGLAGGLFAFSKGSVFPDEMSIPRSFDALLMVLLGGVQSLSGPFVGAAAFTYLHDELITFEYWRLLVGSTIVALVLLFPQGLAGAAKHHLGRFLKLEADPEAAPPAPRRKAREA